jgi:hypothetical protein
MNRDYIRLGMTYRGVIPINHKINLAMASRNSQMRQPTPTVGSKKGNKRRLIVVIGRPLRH